MQILIGLLKLSKKTKVNFRNEESKIVLMKTLFLLLLLICCSCNHWDKISRMTERETRKFNKDPILHCVRIKDSIVSIYLHRNGHFIQLQGPRKREQKNQKFYAGFYKVISDTIFMDYYKGVKPNNMNAYLLKEKSGKFLIYPFQNNRDTLLLTITQGQL